MSRRMIWPLLFGILGCAVLLGLGTWQVQRLAWKASILADMDERLVDTPVALPETPDPEAHRYLPVQLSGTILDEEIAVMASQRVAGPGYHIVSAFETDQGRRIMLDRGFLPAGDRADARPPTDVTITGNLHWPDEMDSFTPDPDVEDRLWFARDIPTMARALDTEPVLIVLRTTTEPDPPAAPMPLDTSAIPNNHLNYAITWFSLAFVWAVMTGVLLWRIRRQHRT